MAQKNYLVEVEKAKEAKDGRPSMGPVYRSLFAKDGFPAPIQGMDSCWDVFRYVSLSPCCLLGKSGKIRTKIKRKKESFVIFSLFYYNNNNYYYYYYFFFGFKTTRNETDKLFSRRKVDCMFLITKCYFIFNNLPWLQNFDFELDLLHYFHFLVRACRVSVWNFNY